MDKSEIVDNSWKLLIVDDEEQVHAVTQMVLDDLKFDGRGIHIFSSFSGADAKNLIQEHSDIAVILLDVVMEQDNSGLEFVEYVRDVLKNRFVRIILRTGQPGQAPERKVVSNYDINHYIEKTEATDERLITLITSALGVYRDMKKATTGQDDPNGRFGAMALNW